MTKVLGNRRPNKIRRKNMDQESSCYTKARNRDQMTFTVIEQDKTAVSTIGWWILQNIETAPAKKLRLALDEALEMRGYPGRKFAD